MKVAGITVMCLVTSLKCLAQPYQLHGRILGADTGYAYIRHRERAGVDSARIVHGRFVLCGSTPKPEFCAFGLRMNGSKDYYFSLFIEPKVMTLRAHLTALNDTLVDIDGSRTEKEFQRFKRESVRQPGRARALFQRLSPAIRNSPFGKAYGDQ